MANPSLLEIGAQEKIAQQFPVQPAADVPVLEVRRKRLAIHGKITAQPVCSTRFASRFPVPGVQGRQAPVSRPSQLTGTIAGALAEAAKRTRYRGTLRKLRDDLHVAPERQRKITRALRTASLCA